MHLQHMPYYPEALLVGKQLRQTRRVKDVTQEELAEVLGVSVSWVGKVERGTEMPNLTYLFKVAQALQVSPRDLLPG